MKIAIVEASHWHVPLYLDALEAEESVEVLAVSDAQQARGPAVARRFGARSYAHWQELLRSEAPDFVFAFGRHDEMPAIAGTLIELGLPFAVEKPAGLTAMEVRDLAARAAEREAFAAVPLIFGFGDLLPGLESLSGVKSAQWQHLSFRFIAGPVERYRDDHCPWMLERQHAGGGCAINLAVHFIDLVLRLTGQEIRTVAAQMIEDPDLGDVEIFSQLTMRTESGAICTVETGYTYPGGAQERREFSFSLASRDSYLRSCESGLRYVPRDGSPLRTVDISLDTDAYYAEFVRRTLRDFRAGRAAPFAGLADMARVMDVLDCAYDSYRRGGEPVMVPRHSSLQQTRQPRRQQTGA